MAPIQRPAALKNDHCVISGRISARLGRDDIAQSSASRVRIRWSRQDHAESKVVRSDLGVCGFCMATSESRRRSSGKQMRHRMAVLRTLQISFCGTDRRSRLSYVPRMEAIHMTEFAECGRVGSSRFRRPHREAFRVSELRRSGRVGLRPQGERVRHGEADPGSRVVGDGAAHAAAAEAAASQIPGTPAGTGSSGAVRDHLRAANRNSVGASAAGAWLRLRHELLAAAAGLAGNRSLGSPAPCSAAAAATCRPHQLGAGGGRFLVDPRDRRGKKRVRTRPIGAVRAASITS
jgi:hypothetical protein